MTTTPHIVYQLINITTEEVADTFRYYTDAWVYGLLVERQVGLTPADPRLFRIQPITVKN